MEFMSALQKSKEKSGKSAREIAEACGLSESTVARYLGGKSTPPVDIAQKILKYLDDAAPEAVSEDALSETRKDDTITLPAWVYRKQINDMREDHQNTLKHMTRQHTLLFCTVLALVAVIVYLVLDASHGGWGIFQYSNFYTSGGVL